MSIHGVNKKRIVRSPSDHDHAAQRESMLSLVRALPRSLFRPRHATDGEYRGRRPYFDLLPTGSDRDHTRGRSRSDDGRTIGCPPTPIRPTLLVIRP